MVQSLKSIFRSWSNREREREKDTVLKTGSEGEEERNKQTEEN